MNTTENINSTPQIQNNPVKPFKFPPQPQEWKIVSLRECPTPADIQLCDTPEQAAAYWKLHIQQHPYFDPERECLVVLILNTRRKIKGHYFVSVGTMDTVLCDPKSIFRLAVMASAFAIVVMHNHPSGQSEPSQADIQVTRDLIRAGQLLKIDVVDHVVIGNGNHSLTSGIGLLHILKTQSFYGFAAGGDFFEARFCARVMILAKSTPRAEVIRSSVSKLGLWTSCST